MRAGPLILLYLAVVCLPLALSWMLGLPPRPLRHEVASGLGMLAFSMILAEFVLSGRFRTISGGVGLDHTIRFHQLMARTALVFALAHPFLYRWLPGPQRPWDVSRQLTLTTDFTALASGIAAFVLLPSLVMLAFNRDALGYRHELWRLLHGLGALLIAGLLLHHALEAGRYSAHPPLVWTWSTMTAIAVLSMLFVYVLKPAYQHLHPWRVSLIERLSPHQWRIRIAPKGHAGVPYEAGQFVWLNIGHSPFSLRENPFSIASAPRSGPELEFIVKGLGDFTRSLDSIAPGTTAYIDGPHGTLTADGRAEPGIALIAGGVGIAPLLGILRELRLANDPRPVTLIYGNRSAAQIAFGAQLDEMARDARVTLVHTLCEPSPGWTGEVGFVDADLLDRTFTPGQFAEWLFVLCGPPAMLTSVEEALLARGVAAGRILSERFEYD
ncbi:ferredoxin reductase family protein [Aestuariicoccus sp. MJ-SS9]|uniref:ferredoxin reductase family protein n=1 Tax=Aestuariicoccus sp. MJ-SS9 TaxID=3079855 RepID=UPI00291394EC|nr:ferredoxin reductase family protein [Aestuariicoccus sp. MJ-SS9]MDU8911615.1 ferredoxin reductase family protein [Aestuariicoccus sp. MJ-SS9]